MGKFFNTPLDHDKIYLSHWQSALGSVKETMENMVACGLIAHDAQTIVLDTHAELTELPPTDILTFSGFSMFEDDDNQAYHFSFMVGFSPKLDTNGFKTAKVMSVLLGRFKGLTSINVLQERSDGTDGFDVLGTATVTSGSGVSPVTKANTRIFQFVEVDLLSDVALRFTT